MTENPHPHPSGHQPEGTAPSPTPGYGPTGGSGYGGYPGYGYGTGQQQGAGPRPAVGMGRALRNWWAYKFQGHGRASLSEYWWTFLALWLISVALGAVGMVVLFATAVTTGSTYSSSSTYAASAHTEFSGVGIAVMLLLSLAATVLGLLQIPLQVRRLHDADLSGGFWFLSLIPGVGGLILIVLLCLPSKPQGQRFDTPADIGRP